ncbi:hypothetical protein [Arsenicicoccus sp. oral taxon 190]|uniref:hypothetical protein n=1 Tax=Arsenicicoccus sp. oral taxon 190 TaxID=1658671 RepID=UPI00067A13FC|nr:hypothetical protein [Arsenicicoccus sp. oral taxon 190]AKT52302.1 hypothetical protein ADJ73_15310 [Arsenicicoccus sp. oral taxon 190]
MRATPRTFALAATLLLAALGAGCSAPPAPAAEGRGVLAAPAAPTLARPARMALPSPPPAPLPTPPLRTALEGRSCDEIVRAVNGSAARCVDVGDPALRAQTVAGGDVTVGLTDEDQHVVVLRELSTEDTYLVAMHERGHQELRQRCDTWTCGDRLTAALGTTRGAWADGPYFDRVAEIAASTWARCHGADNPRYGYRLSCTDLARALDTEATARERSAEQLREFDAAWARYHQAYERYRATQAGVLGAPAAATSH